ncbi:MAG: hypothetical protein QGH11_07140 [Pirellulaceae bacterium]|nr:hypothetical protein [Pirellulaceae bacterium]
MSKYLRTDILDDDSKDLPLSSSFLKELDYSMIFAAAVYLGCLVSSVWAPGRNLVLILILPVLVLYRIRDDARKTIKKLQERIDELEAEGDSPGDSSAAGKKVTASKSAA